MREPGGILARHGLERSQQTRVMRSGPFGRQVRLNGETSQLVAKPQAAPLVDENSCADRIVDGSVLDAEGPQESAVHDSRFDGSHLEKVASAGGEPSNAGEDRVPNARRYRGSRGCQDLRHEEGIATRRSVQLTGIDRMTGRQHPNTARCQRLDADACQPRRGEVAEHSPQGMVRADLIVSHGTEDQRGRCTDSAPDEPEKVQRRLVGPVEVFHDGHSRYPEVGKEGIERLVDGDPSREAIGCCSSASPCHIHKRAERSGCRERIASSPEHPCA